ncbi:hypothetical protein Rhopal_002554-T1 [Rhodotorula paludigena]|uniref:F-box domain-containing protein n=1 Tax=Rhodotorula paludigena TaxID=86838 RepID=A0AAV5GJE7_9BASI|nr:hypothetical protein Rhopal_002554-T1 [Rhodotorula paludigena]
MASSLPDEIVLLIFETLAKPQWDREGYSERQRTLSLLALVCRRFHRLAEPLLWRQLRFDKWQSSTLRKVQRLLPGSGQHVRAMKATTKYRPYNDEQISTQQVAEVVRMLPTLTEVRLDVGLNNDGLFKRLAKLTSLTSLALVNVGISETMCREATVVFPHLVDLRLRQWTFRYNVPLTEPPVPPVLRQVDFENVAFYAKALSNHTRLLLNPALVESSNSETGGDIIFVPTYATREWKSSLDEICDLLGDGQLPQVRSFFIPDQVRDILSASAPEYAAALDNFLRACATAGVEVRWLADEAEDELVCREFWAYSRELAARRSQEQQEAQVDTVA